MNAVALLILCLQAAPGEQDVLVLKDGTTRTGRIVSESDREVVLETFIKSSKGQVVGSAKLTVATSDIARIERASAESRKQADDRSKAFSERGVRRAEALSKITPVPARVEGREGVQVTGAYFVLQSTCDPVFVKDLALSLDEVFAAYRKYFDIRRNAEKKVRILVFSDRQEYETYTIARIGRVVAPVAYYQVADNTIAAYNLIEREKERQIRQETLESQRDIEKFRTDVQTLQRRIDGLAKDVRQQIQDEAAELRRKIKAANPPDRDQRLREVDRREKELLEELKDGKATAQKDLQDARRKATDAIDKCSQVIDRNEKVLAGQNSQMFETLFHEGFHAFAANYLWEGSGQREFPRWLHEGMACYFERSVVEGGTLIHGAVHPELLKTTRERYILRSNIPLEKVLRSGPEAFALNHPTEAERRTAYYAQSWALAHYLVKKVTPKQIETYVNEVLAGKDGVEAFERMAGKKCADLEAELRAHLDALK